MQTLEINQQMQRGAGRPACNYINSALSIQDQLNEDRSALHHPTDDRQEHTDITDLI